MIAHETAIKVARMRETEHEHPSTHHVLYGWPRHGPGIEVLLQKGGARVEVTIVKLVWDAPPQWAEFSALL